jgi:hypothetical protein
MAPFAFEPGQEFGTLALLDRLRPVAQAALLASFADQQTRPLVCPDTA